MFPDDRRGSMRGMCFGMIGAPRTFAGARNLKRSIGGAFLDAVS
jgi:hypothetical protein